MKILYLTLPGPDHLTDQLYTGLRQLLGADNVVDFPYKPEYHDPRRKVWFLPQVHARAYTADQILAALANREFAFACLAARPIAFQTLSYLWGKAPFPPLVLLDGEEDTKIRHDLFTQFPFSLYFKRDYVWGLRPRPLDFLDVARAFKGNRILFQRTFPLPLAVALETIPPTPSIEKTVDVSYTGRASHRDRVTAVKLLKAQKGLRFEGGLYRDPGDMTYKLKDHRIERLFDKYFPSLATAPSYEVSKLVPDTDSSGQNPYFDQIFRSKIALCVRGGGLTPPIRYYEIVACRTLLLSDIPFTVIPNNFEHKRHAVFFRRDMTDLLEVARYFTRHDSDRETIVEEGYKHLLSYHTCERRAEYFLDTCLKML